MQILVHWADADRHWHLTARQEAGTSPQAAALDQALTAGVTLSFARAIRLNVTPGDGVPYREGGDGHLDIGGLEVAVTPLARLADGRYLLPNANQAQRVFVRRSLFQPLVLSLAPGSSMRRTIASPPRQSR